jgi:hypothetical protein
VVFYGLFGRFPGRAGKRFRVRQQNLPGSEYFLERFSVFARIPGISLGLADDTRWEAGGAVVKP